MKTASTFPKITNVTAQSQKTLLVEFENGEKRLYDCKPLLKDEAFRPLQNEALFRLAHADPHGYGVVWNHEIDLAESEIWLHGRPERNA